MPTVVCCDGCGGQLSESPGLSPEEREPCPQCGSLIRRARIHVSSAVAAATVGAVTAQGYATFSPASGLLLQAVVILGEKVPDGRLIEAVAPPWIEIARMPATITCMRAPS
jgi:hypothetical protein